MENAVVFAIGGGTPDAPQMSYLDRPVPATPEILHLAQPVEPDEVFRIAAKCAGHKCVHFTGANCDLARRTVSLLAPVVSVLPPCRIRPACRWFAEQGVAACVRCPQVVTRNFHPTTLIAKAARDPSQSI